MRPFHARLSGSTRKTGARGIAVGLLLVLSQHQWPLVVMGSDSGLNPGVREDIAITSDGLELCHLTFQRPEEAVSAASARSGSLGLDVPRASTLVPYGVPAIKLYVAERGIYRVSGADLAQAEPRWLGARLDDLRMLCRGRSVPIWIDDADDDGILGPEDAIEFWGEPYRPDAGRTPPDRYFDPYTKVNVYWLTQASTLPSCNLIALQGALSGGFKPEVTWGYREVHIEEDRLYDRLGRVPYPADRDHWFWGTVSGGHLETFTFDLGVPDTTSWAEVRLRVCLSGRTYEDLGNHEAQVFLGTKKLEGTLSWRDQDYLIAEFGPDDGANPACLRKGTNLIGILNLSPDEANEILFNWAELRFPQRYEASHGVLEFGSPSPQFRGRVRFRLLGFSSPDVDVYKLGIGKFRGCRSEFSEEEGSWDIVFEDEVVNGNEAYVAVERGRKRKPLAIRPESRSFWALENSAGYDYVIVGPDSFLSFPATDSLVALREAEGLRVVRVDIEDLYDEFAFGLHTPLAVRRFMLHALDSWATKPRYLLLVGLGGITRETFDNPWCPVPAMRAQTVKYGSVVCDNLFVARSIEEPVPELAVGRLPVRNRAELSVVVRKLWGFQGAQVGEWNNRILLIAGNGSYFKDQVEEIIRSKLDWGLELRRLDVGSPRTRYTGDTEDLLGIWNQGLAVIHFLGHGGGRIWSDARLMTYDEGPLLQNGDRLPFVASWTCFTAAMDPQGSLGMSLLLHPEGGAVAVLGSTGVGWVWNDYYLLNELIRTMQDSSITTIGEAIRRAKLSYFSKYSGSLALTQLNQFTLLGDPATPIRLTRNRASGCAYWDPGNGREVIVESRCLEHLDSVRVQVFFPATPAISEEVRHEIVDSKLRVRLSDAASTQRADSLLLRVFCWDARSGEAAHAVVAPEKKGDAIDSLWWVPSSPRSGDPVMVYVRLRDRLELQAELTCGGDHFPFGRFGHDLLRTVSPWIAEAPGLYSFMIVFRDSLGRTVDRRFATVEVGESQALWVQQTSVRLVSGEQGPELTCRLFLRPGESAAECEVAFSLASSDRGPWQLVGTDTVLLVPGGVAEARVPMPLSPPGNWVRVEYGPLGSTARYTVWAQLSANEFWMEGRRFCTNSGWVDTLLAGEYELTVADELPRGGFLRYRWISDDTIEATRARQDGFLRPDAGGYRALEISFRGPDALSLRVAWTRPDSADESLRVCRLTDAGQWETLPKGKEAAILVSPDAPTVLGLVRVVDRRPPFLRLEANGRPLMSGDLLSPGDAITLRACDPGGISPGGLLPVKVDGKPADQWVRSFAYAEGGALWTVAAELDPGEHELAFQVQDCAGNVAEEQIRLEVSGKPGLKFLGNYPNPFFDETVVVFELWKRAQRLHVEVFAPSGAKIRTLRGSASDDPDLLAAGYHEIVWDGKDERGQRVAFGVYFLRIAALIGGKWYEEVAKIARLP